MKILLLIFLPALSFAQPKGSNTIIVHPVTMEAVVKNLEAMKFGVANDGFGTITTIPKYVENHGHMQITVTVKDTTAYISGTFFRFEEPAEITPELFKNDYSYGGHYLGGTFKVLDTYAHSLGGTITYSKQP